MVKLISNKRLFFLKGQCPTDSAQANTARSRIFHEYLRENELLSKTILACLSGAHGWLRFMKYKNVKKSRDTAPLKVSEYCLSTVLNFCK